MKSRIATSVVFILIAATAFAADAATQSDAQKSFDKMKTLAGSWEGHVTTVPLAPEIDGKLMQVSLRATSMGNALMHEMTGAGRPDDPITMLYLDRRESAPHDRQDSARRKNGGIRFFGCRRQHGVRTHAPRSVHHHRRQLSHRGLDVHDARGQADARALRTAADKVTTFAGPFDAFALLAASHARRRHPEESFGSTKDLGSRGVKGP